MAKEINKKTKSRIINFVFFGVLLVFLISTPAKSWLLRGILNTGLFAPKIEQKKSSESAAMPLTFNNGDGTSLSTSEFRGKVVFINFWASWCPPCIAEMPSMNKMYGQLKSDPAFEFVFINLDDEVNVAAEFIQKKGFAIPLHRAEGFIPTDLYTGTLPTTIVLNKDGAVVMKHTGMADYTSKKFIAQLKALR